MFSTNRFRTGTTVKLELRRYRHQREHCVYFQLVTLTTITLDILLHQQVAL